MVRSCGASIQRNRRREKQQNQFSKVSLCKPRRSRKKYTVPARVYSSKVAMYLEIVFVAKETSPEFKLFDNLEIARSEKDGIINRQALFPKLFEGKGLVEKKDNDFQIV